LISEATWRGIEDAGERGLPLIDLVHAVCPEPSCNGFITQYFGGGSVYRITIVTETVGRRAARSTNAAPVSPYDFPRQLTRARDCEDRGDEDSDLEP
jgi:hypothetical protein